MAVEAASEYDRLSEDEKAIVKSAERYADKNLMKIYSQETDETDFLKKVSHDTIQTYIRPFIEARHREMLGRIRIARTPLFRRERVYERDFRAARAVEILSEPSDVSFLFRNAETFTYVLQIKNGNREMPLFGQFFAPLCSHPAEAVVGNRLHFFEDLDEKKLRPFISKQHVEVPRPNIAEYIRKFVVQCVKNYNVVASGLSVYEQKYRPSAVLNLETDFELRSVLHLQFRYGNRLFEIDRPYGKETEVVESGEGLPSIGWFYRDEEWEAQCIRRLEENGLERKDGYCFTVRGDGDEKPDSVVEWIYKNGQLLRQFTLTQSFAKQRFYTGEIDLQLTANDCIDWFDLHCVARFGDMEIPFYEFKRHILKNIRKYLLPDGSIAVLPSEWFTRFEELFRFGRVVGNAIRLDRFHFRVKELAEKGSLSDWDVGELPVPSIPPPTLNATLRPYQAEGFRWLAYLREKHFGGCLADDMGLGKTLQTIASLLQVYSGPDSEKFPEKENMPRQLSLFEETFSPKKNCRNATVRDDVPPSLIVMPTSLLHNWSNELSKFAPSLKVYLHTGIHRLRDERFAAKMSRVQIVLTSYGIVRNDIDFLSRHRFLYLVLDESQYIKNPSSQTFATVKQLNSVYRLSLTGTPIENSITDLWAQMEILNEGILGTQTEFQKRFRQPDLIDDEEKRRMLLNIVKPFILRRSKEEVAPELPPLTEEICVCEMSEEQHALYTEEKNKVRNALSEKFVDGNRPRGVAVLKSLMHLRLLANHPVLAMPGFQGESGKFGQIIAYAETLFAEGHKVLVFSSFVKHLRLFADCFEKRGWPYAWLTGNSINRAEEIEKFNTDESIRAFFISLKAGGTGLNLTAADYVFIIDPWWNPSAEMQAVSRAHRIGQNKKVTLYRFISKDSIEEKILRLQQRKSALADALIMSQLTPEDMNELLQ